MTTKKRKIQRNLQMWKKVSIRR